jgi:hypothetical protein
MGQTVNVVEKPSSKPGVVRFETNRVLGGMGHDRYTADLPVEGNRAVDELARRLIAHGGVAGVHIYSGIITVDLAKGHSSDGLADIIRDLYRYYPDTPAPSGDDPPSAEESHGESAADPEEVVDETPEDAPAPD